MARRGGGPKRDIHGIVLLDKPVGRTSNAALQRVKSLLQARKAGHTGSLDPLASGMLPICLGEATKVSAYLLDADKHYTVSARFGERTETGDAEGPVVERRGPSVVPAERIEAALGDFRGVIEQVPPMYSALKHKGKRLYALAREGIEVERKARPVTIYDLELTSVRGSDWQLRVRCSKGTYVRTLVEDIAAAVDGVAHVTALRRTAVGPFIEDGMVTLEEIEDRCQRGAESALGLIRPVDEAIGHWPAVRLGTDSAWYLGQGQPVTVPRAPADGWVRLYRAGGDFVGIGEVMDDGRIAPRRMFRHAKSC